MDRGVTAPKVVRGFRRFSEVVRAFENTVGTKIIADLEKYFQE